MEKDNRTENYNDWYKLWMKQSKEFFASAEDNLQNVFNKEGYAYPEDHLKQINKWLNILKNQWSLMEFPDDQDGSIIYWKNMNRMCYEASDFMLEQWIKRTREGRPLKNVQELYALWLDSCHEVYDKHLRTKAYQDTYGDLMKAAFQFWKTNIPQ